MTTGRRFAAIAAGLVQVVVGLGLAVASIESLGLLGDDAEVNWLLAGPAIALVATTGLTVAFVAGRQSWLRDGGLAMAAGLALTVVSAAATGSIGLGLLAMVLIGFAPAVVGEPG